MNETEIIKAFTTLGLGINASQSEVKEAYRSLSSKNHPDKNLGGSNKQKDINRAYEIAKVASQKSTELMVINNSVLVSELKKQIQMQTAIFNSTSIQNSLIKRAKISAESFRNTALWFTFGAGFLALFSKLIFPDLAANLSEESIAKIGSKLSVATFILGSISLYLNFRIKHVENRVDDYSERLSDANYCANQLMEILKDKNSSKIYKSQCRSPVGLPMYMDSNKIVSLIFSKAVEHGFFEEVAFSQSENNGPDGLNPGFKLTQEFLKFREHT